MADFAYCRGVGCPLAERCTRYRRYKAEAADGALDEHQSYIVEPFDKVSGECSSLLAFHRPVT